MLPAFERSSLPLQVTVLTLHTRASGLLVFCLCRNVAVIRREYILNEISLWRTTWMNLLIFPSPRFWRVSISGPHLCVACRFLPILAPISLPPEETIGRSVQAESGPEIVEKDGAHSRILDGQY